jgi:hypothetical protein
MIQVIVVMSPSMTMAVRPLAERVWCVSPASQIAASPGETSCSTPSAPDTTASPSTTARTCRPVASCRPMRPPGVKRRHATKACSVLTIGTTLKPQLPWSVTALATSGANLTIFTRRPYRRYQSPFRRPSSSRWHGTICRLRCAMNPIDERKPFAIRPRRDSDLEP